MNVVCYARVSSEKQAEKDLSIPAQLKALKKYALEHGWGVVAEYVDEAESARTANRPQFREMISAAKRKYKPFDAILVWKLSRFARNREDSILYKSLLRRHGIQVISINEPVDDSAAGKLLEGMIEVIDEFYSTNLAEDVLRGMAENASKGFYNGGKPPFGYKRVKVSLGGIQKSMLEIDDTEAPVLKRIAQLALAGHGGKEIAKNLNRDGAKTRNGKNWSKTIVNKLLQREVYTGCAAWKGRNGDTIRYPNAYPVLIPRDDFDKIQELMADRKSIVRHPRTVNSQYLLSSLLHCARCGASMIGCAAKSGKFHYYRCNSALRHDPAICKSGWLPKKKIEGFVIDKLRKKILTEENLVTLVQLVNEEVDLLAKQGKERLEEIEKQLKSISDKLLKYYIAFEKGTLTEADAAPRIKELRAEQVRLQNTKEDILAEGNSDMPRQLDAKQVMEYVKDLKALLEEGAFTEQKAFLRSFIKRIDYTPDEVAISYTIPMPVGEDKLVLDEVLSMEPYGRPCRSRTCDTLIKSQVFSVIGSEV
jgi:site-specific DNA recombinase